MRENIFRMTAFVVGVLVGFLFAHIYGGEKKTSDFAHNIERQVDSIVGSEPSEANDSRLPAPTFLHPGVLTSDQYGQIYLAWKQIEGAKGYQVTVFDQEGKTTKNFRIVRNITSVTGLYVDPRAGQTPYKAQVMAIDDQGNLGKPSEMKDLAMLPMRNLAPPSIKSITTQ